MLSQAILQDFEFYPYTKHLHTRESTQATVWSFSLHDKVIVKTTISAYHENEKGKLQTDSIYSGPI